MLDLKALAGRKFRTVLDESAELDGSQVERPWYVRIPCQHGHVFVHGRETLGAYCASVRVIPKLLAIPGVTLRQRGDFEASVSFAPDLLDQVAAVLKARRRRQISETERARLISIGRLPTMRGSKAAPETTDAAQDVQTIDSASGSILGRLSEPYRRQQPARGYAG